MEKGATGAGLLQEGLTASATQGHETGQQTAEISDATECNTKQ